ncbi:MAG: PAS domain S-box protein [Calditrichaeota bacterium]|nr:PAS domain S-box protein [Calditrichota bacterium]
MVQKIFNLSENQKTALRIALSYVFIGVLWMLVFRFLLPHFFHSTVPAQFEGWLFILITALFIYKSINAPLLKNQQIARALKHNEEKYRTLVEDINEVIFVIDQFGKITYISPAIHELTGYTPNEMIGHLFLEFIAPEDEEKIYKAFKERLRNIIKPMQYRLVRKDGGYRWVRSLSRPFNNQRGSRGIRGVLMDITDMVEKDKALIESEARWRSLVEQAPDYIITTDLQGKIQFVNRNFFSVAENLVIGQMIYDLVPQSEMKKIHKAIDMVNSKKLPYRFEIELTVDEQKRWYFIRVGPIKNKEKMVGLTFIATDITRRKEYEQELQEYRSHLQNLVSERTLKLKTANLELDAYNRIVDQSLKNLLTEISEFVGEIEVLIESDPNKSLKQKLEKLRENALQLNTQFEKLLKKVHRN